MNTPTITSATVKVMRSYNYCHFEVSLSTSDSLVSGISGPSRITVTHVDELRKTAARLADKAVDQYKIAKRQWDNIDSDVYQMERLKRSAKDATDKPEQERTPFDKSAIKKLQDREHWNRRNYNYEDDYEDEKFDYTIDEEDDAAF